MTLAEKQVAYLNWLSKTYKDIPLYIQKQCSDCIFANFDKRVCSNSKLIEEHEKRCTDLYKVSNDINALKLVHALSHCKEKSFKVPYDAPREDSLKNMPSEKKDIPEVGRKSNVEETLKSKFLNSEPKSKVNDTTSSTSRNESLPALILTESQKQEVLDNIVLSRRLFRNNCQWRNF